MSFRKSRGNSQESFRASNPLVGYVISASPKKPDAPEVVVPIGKIVLICFPRGRFQTLVGAPVKMRDQAVEKNKYDGFISRQTIRREPYGGVTSLGHLLRGGSKWAHCFGIQASVIGEVLGTPILLSLLIERALRGDLLVAISVKNGETDYDE